MANAPVVHHRWEGGVVDISNGGYIATAGSGGALSLGFARSVYFEGVRVTAGDTVYGTQANKRGDLGLGGQRVKKTTVIDCELEGLNDLGIYFTGSGVEGDSEDDDLTSDNSTDLTMIGTKFYRCSAGYKAVREFRRISTSACQFIECKTGILGGEPSDAGPSQGHTIIGNHFYRCERRAIDLRGYGPGIIINGNVLEDCGRNPDDLSENADAQGIFLATCPGAIITNNALKYRLFIPPSTGEAIQVSGDGNWGQHISHNYVQGYPVGISITGASTTEFGSNYLDNIFQDVTTPLSLTGNDDARWSYTLIQVNGSGIPTGSTRHESKQSVQGFTASLVCAGGDPDGDPSNYNYAKQAGEYVVNHGVCTWHAECQFAPAWITTAPSGQVRMTGLPTAKNNSGIDAVVGIGRMVRLGDAAGETVYAEIQANQAYVTFRRASDGTALEGSDLTSGLTIIAHLGGSYIVE